MMNELIAHSMIYPEMEIQDAVKLLYQQTFGSGHMITDKEENLQRLKAEYESSYGDAPLIEPIGGGISRIYLSAAKREGIPPELIQKLFLKASEKTADINEFESKLKLFSENCKRGLLPFDTDKVDKFTEEYRKLGFPPQSHSEAYKRAYAPSYRLIFSEHARLLPVFMSVMSCDKESPFIIGIDGKCGSGKTTVSLILEELFGACVIHMDDFFLPPELRTKERLDEAGGNIHYERFEEEVLPYIKNEKPFSYRKFDCSKADFSGAREINGNLRIVEGSYSLHDKFSEIYDLKVFTDISPEKQKERIIAREGEIKWKAFEEKWIPMENKYFEMMNIKEKCDIIIE